MAEGGGEEDGGGGGGGGGEGCGKTRGEEGQTDAGEGNTTVEGCRCGRVKYPSDGQFSGGAWEKEGKSRERRERKIGCSAKERKRTNCLLIRPDNCRWARAHLVSNHLDLTLPRTLPVVRILVPRFLAFLSASAAVGFLSLFFVFFLLSYATAFPRFLHRAICVITRKLITVYQLSSVQN